jgi:hypothetical protein
MGTVTAVYDDINDAQRALHDLVGHGFAHRDISLITNDSSGEYARYINNPNHPSSTTGKATTLTQEGIGGGAIIGGIAGLLVGLGAIVIPGIGAALAAGPIFSLIGAGLGAVTGGLLGALVDLGVPETTAGSYAEAVRRGSTLVIVNTNDKLTDRAEQIVNRHGPIDITQRVEFWRTSGWTKFDPEAAAYQQSDIERARQLARDYNDRIKPDTAGVG